MIINYLNIEADAIKATIILAFLGIILLVDLALFFSALRAQHRYNNNMLPTFPGLELEEEDDYLMEDSREEENGISAFSFDDDDDMNVTFDEGGQQANELLKAARSAQGSHVAEEPKKKKGFFGKKSE